MSDPTNEQWEKCVEEAIVRFAPTGFAVGEASYVARELTEWSRSTGCDLDREIVAHNLWTMGARLKHRKCVADNDSNYECVCKPCNTYLRAVADSVLLAAHAAYKTEGGTSDE